MALVNITTIITDTKRVLQKIDPPGGVELLSYKRNRGIADNLVKELKPLIKHEFPRSRKVRLIKFSDPQELERSHQKI